MMMKSVGSRLVATIAGGLLVGMFGSGATALFAQTAPAASAVPTFTKDIAPILQEKCQLCHRAGEIAPMALVTYEETRPWVRSMRAKVLAGEMPPWFIDKSVGIQQFKDDASLSDAQIQTLVAWIDGGAPRGNPGDLPRAKEWPKNEGWQLAATLGPPDIIVKSKPWTMPATGPDRWWEPVIDAGLTEDRWVRAVELKPSIGGRKIVHHAVVHASEMQPDRSLGEFAFVETSIGSYGEVYDENTGKLLKAGTKFRFDIHYHSVGEEITDETEMGVYLYPKGVTPKFEVKHVPIGLTGIAGRVGSVGIDIPPHSVARHDAYMVLQQPALLLNFKPHMHFRGKAMEIAALYPDNRYEVLSYVNRYNFNWHVSYVYKDDVAPLLPKGTVIHVTSWHDNTSANKYNPDPNQWVGSGSRSVDEMTHAHTNMMYLSQEEFDRRVKERAAKQPARESRPSGQQDQH